mgnify:CR=1 FL=1
MRHETPAERLARELDWNLLRTFLVIATSQSITDAADRLSLKQPTDSSALKRLEDRLGKQLVERKPGRFALTDAGKLLYEETIDIHGAILRLGTVMRNVENEVQGLVRIATASHVVCPLLDTALSDFHARHPRATLSIEAMASKDALAAVASRRVSFAVCLVKDRSPRLEYRRLFREYFGIFCGPTHALFGKTGVEMADLAGQSSVSFITDQMSDALRAVTLMRSEAQLDARIVGTSPNLEEVRRMIVAGLGIGPLPIHVVREDIEMGKLSPSQTFEAPPHVDVHVVWNPNARTNRAEATLLADLLDKIETTPMEERIYV